jgi:hypothetical protein
MIGKYEVIAQPLPHSAHMLSYAAFVDGTRIGAFVSVPTEFESRFLETPPVVPRLNVYQPTHRPGRRKKGSTPPMLSEKAAAPPREELPDGLALPDTRNTDDR